MAIDTTDVIAPVFTATEVVVFLSAGVTGETSFRYLLRRLVLEGNNLLGIPFLSVRFAWTMARLAARHLAVPTRKFRQLSMRRMREGLELVFVTVFTCVTADVITRLVLRLVVLGEFSRRDRRRLRGIGAAKPRYRGQNERTD